LSDSSDRPIIGITVDAAEDPADSRTRGKLTLNWNYAQVIADAGGVPLLIPPQADPEVIAQVLDGWLIPGGNDIDPAYWGEELHPEAKLIDEARHLQERAIYRHIPTDLPVLGVCYGCQFINVVQGGSLKQHLPDELDHARDQGGTVQDYAIEPDSHLHGIVGTPRAEGQSWHHQAVGRVGDGLRVSATNEDGTIEALESTERPWLIGVQWHPERTPDAEDSRAIFKRFVEAAADYRSRR